MTRFSLEGYRKQWPRIGGVLAMALGGATALAAGRMSKPQTRSAVNFGALLVHQYEEYQDPGWFPGQFNRGLFKSDSPHAFTAAQMGRYDTQDPCPRRCSQPKLSRTTSWLT